MIKQYLDLKIFSLNLISYKNYSNFVSNLYFNYDDLIQLLIDNNYIRIIDDEIVVSEKLKNELNLKSIESEVEDWIEEWRELFPKGRNKSGYPYRGDKQGCINKMKKFVRKYNYSKDIIFRATENYVAKLYSGILIKQAHFFIEKNGISDLAAEIEILKNEGEQRTEDPNWG